MKKICFYLIIVAALVYSCTEKTLDPISQSKGKPGVVTSVEVEQTPGGAILSYLIPNDEDILEVKAVYTTTNGQKRAVNASFYDNHLNLVGYNDTLEHEALLYTVNRAKYSLTL
jgi:hypothetical protein